MRKSFYTGLILSIAVCGAARADTLIPPDSGGNQSLNQYMLNLGKYLGYDLTTFCPTPGGCTQGSNPPYNDFLISATTASGSQLNLLTNFLGAIVPNLALVLNSNGQGNAQNPFAIVPSSSDYSALMKQYGAQTFVKPNAYSSGGNGVTISPLIDQQPYQNDPVSQAVLNILSTPDYSYCESSSGLYSPCYTGNNNKPISGSGPVISQAQVMLNVIGSTPSTSIFPLGAANAGLVSQLSPDSLIGPMMFSTSGSPDNTKPPLTAQGQLQQAANYIRYASGAVAPMSLPSRNSYDSVYQAASNNGGSGQYTTQQQVAAQAVLANYLTGLRVYAAQTAVGISNLYAIFSKRLPQQDATGKGNSQTSQTLSEFNMATWRLYSPSSEPSQQWINSLNQASSATVQKEIAVLLAEINYQMYLNRQQQERMLLTQSMMLLQNAHAPQWQPSPSLGTSGSSPPPADDSGTGATNSDQ